MDIIKSLSELEEIIKNHQDLLAKEARIIFSSNQLPSAESLEKHINEMEDKNRVLQIGIVGKVKAGKSSLLNALIFDGKPILPKAATPMTAALTIISYGEKPTAEIDFFTRKDIELIEDNAREYEDLLKRTQKKLIEEAKEKAKKENKSVDEDKCRKQAKLEVDKDDILKSSYDQHNRMKSSGVNIEALEKAKIIEFENISELIDKLSDYVGSSGHYMPFTKSVHIKLPLESLKNIQIIDTPGLNDPVVSREERTKEFLKYCDVIFIVSPAGQFISEQDIDLMDRITSKEGIRELYVIASQFDLQLHGDTKDESGGDLSKACEIVIKPLAEHLNETLTKLKESNPEIGNTFDSLIEQSEKKIIHCSAVSLTIKEYLNGKISLDDGDKHAWDILKKSYPDHFSEEDKKISSISLDLLSNITTIKDIINGVRLKKDDILKHRKDEYISAKINTFNDAKEELIKFVKNRFKEVNDGNLNELNEKRKNIAKIKKKATDVLDNTYLDSIDELKLKLTKILLKELSSYYEKTTDKIKDKIGTDYEIVEYKVKKDGGLNGLRRIFRCGGYDIRKKEEIYTNAWTNQIVTALDEFAKSIKTNISLHADEYKHEWKNCLNKKILEELREYIGDKEIDTCQIRKIIRNVLSCMPNYEIYYNNIQSLPSKGKLIGDQADKFIMDANKWLSDLDDKVTNDIHEYIRTLFKSLKNVDISKEFFTEYEDELTELESEIKNKKVVLDEITMIQAKLIEVCD